MSLCNDSLEKLLKSIPFTLFRPPEVIKLLENIKNDGNMETIVHYKL